MNPVSLTAISLAGSAGAGISGALGSLFQGRAQSKSYAYQAGVADINSKIQKQNADYERNVGEVKAQQVGLKTAADIGTAKTVQGASGLDVNTGSNSQVRDSMREIGQQDARVSRANTARRAYGFEVGAMEAASQGQMYRSASKTSRTAGYIGAASSILGAASSVSSKWLTASSSGIGSSRPGGMLLYGTGEDWNG